MPENLKEIIEKCFSFRPNKNQLRVLSRLIFEIMREQNLSLENILTTLRQKTPLDKYSGGTKFFYLRDTLIKYRFPLTYKKEKIDTKKVFLAKLQKPLRDNWQAVTPFVPEKVFIEKNIKNSELAKRIKKKFPNSNIQEIDCYNSYLKQNKFDTSQLKKPLLFLIKEQGSLLKQCPCTKRHLSCGYWIFNLGFGCPFDCSYCFLQQYTNFPGILLPANLEDFFEKFDKFYKNLKKPIRIGTGEFCDSLALDHITEYSKKLIPYFSNKNVLFELKTKSKNIGNLLTLDASKNIVISWSLNPQCIIDTEEKLVASLDERLKAARAVQVKGYSIAFHFDPIIHIKNWQSLYEKVIDKLYSCVKPAFAWISLGTLRCNKELKTVTESRFPESNIFYGELFIGEDKKLRYPKFIRNEIYKKITKHIRTYDSKTPIYLCMEDKESWKLLGNIKSAKQIETYLLKP